MFTTASSSASRISCSMSASLSLRSASSPLGQGRRSSSKRLQRDISDTARTATRLGVITLGFYASQAEEIIYLLLSHVLPSVVNEAEIRNSRRALGRPSCVKERARARARATDDETSVLC